MRVLIVDDEPLARVALQGILAARADVDRFDSAVDAVEAQQRLASDNYDVMLLDISMPEVSGLELLARLQRQQRPMPAVVLVTAHAEYALAAFEKHAVDYILKPFSADRVNQALEFAGRRSTEERAARLVELMPHFSALTRRGPAQVPTKIGIKIGGRILFIDPREVVSVKAEGNYVLLQRGNGSDLARGSISDIAEKLMPYGFVRIHRSVLINGAFVKEIRACSTGEYDLRTQDGREFTVTRTYKKNLKSLAGFWIGPEPFTTD